jgi:uncharacterized protein (DUF488 family)
MKIYTIGFTQKSAKEFFGLLKQNHIKRVVDIRISPQGQLSAFARQEDLPYFLDNLSNHCTYVYMPILAPTKEILLAYRASKDWRSYTSSFTALMDERRIPEVLNRDEFETSTACLLCSESTPEKCHRRLVTERLANRWENVEIVHL